MPSPRTRLHLQRVAQAALTKMDTMSKTSSGGGPSRNGKNRNSDGDDATRSKSSPIQKSKAK